MRFMAHISCCLREFKFGIQIAMHRQAINAASKIDYVLNHRTVTCRLDWAGFGFPESCSFL